MRSLDRYSDTMSTVYVSFYTEGTPYEAEADALTKTLRKFKLKHRIYKRPDRKSWQLNTQQKAEVLKQALEDFPEDDIVWVDADARILKDPDPYFTALEPDVTLAHGHTKKRRDIFLSGTLFFRNNQDSKRIVDKWVQLNRANEKHDQLNLETVVDLEKRKNGLVARKLPKEYCAIFDRVKGPNVVIQHMQRSRRHKQPVSVRQYDTLREFWESDTAQKHIRKVRRGKPLEGWDPVPKLKTFLHGLMPDSVVELGCGFGDLCKAFDPEVYRGVDISRRQIEEARNRYPEYKFLDYQHPIAQMYLVYNVFIHLSREEVLRELKAMTTNYIVLCEVMDPKFRNDGNHGPEGVFTFHRTLDDYRELMRVSGYKLQREEEHDYHGQRGAKMKFTLWRKK